jgi:hypothetical protein
MSPKNEYLVYFTVGYNKVYIDVLNLAIKSLNYFNPLLDILVICDKTFESECKSKLPENVIIVPVPDSTQPAFASINKLKIFNLYDIQKYDKVFFLDTDIITHTDIIPYFEKIIKQDTLYVYTEDTDPLANAQPWFSYNNYNQADLERLQRENIHPFNAGCFGFYPTNTMRDHFNNILDFIKDYKGSLHIYEQSFMNVYFNKINNTDRTLLTKDTYIMFPYRNYPIQSHEGKLIHFTGLVGEGAIKYRDIKKYVDNYMPFLII